MASDFTSDDWSDVDRRDARRRTERAFDRLLSEPMTWWRRWTWHVTQLEAEPWLDAERTALDDDTARRARQLGFEPIALADKRVWNGTRQLSEIWIGPEGFVKLEVVRGLPSSEIEWAEQSQRENPIGRRTLTTYFDDATSMVTWNDQTHEIEFETERRQTVTSEGDLRRDREMHLEEASERRRDETRPLYCTDVELYRDHFQMHHHHLTGHRHLRTGIIRLLWNVVSKVLWAGILVGLTYWLLGTITWYHVSLLGLGVIGTILWDLYNHYHADLEARPSLDD